MHSEQAIENEITIREKITKDSSTFSQKIETIRVWADEFCANSSVHGIRYITGKGRHWTEILWWTFAIGLSVFLCSYSIHNLWEEWSDRPVIVNFDDKQSPVGVIPFPAVTVCPAAKTISSSLNFTEAIDLISPESGTGIIVGDIPNEMKAALHICYISYFNFMIKDYHENFTDNSIYEALNAINSEWTVVSAAWLNEECSESFKPIYTSDGICFTFNMLNSLEIYTDKIAAELLTVRNLFNTTHWSMESGYDTSNKKATLYPYRVSAGGRQASLLFDAIFNIGDWNQHCDGPNKEFKISIHPPDEIPQMWSNFIRIPADHEVSISIKPKVMTTSNALRNSYSPKQRQCFFGSERMLKYFKVYNQANCEIECLAKFTNLRCECVPFYLPRDNNTNICSIGNFHCYKRASDEFYEANPDKLLPRVEQLHEECNCLPACTSIHYDLEISLISGEIINYLRPLVASRHTIYFKSRHFIAMIRSERFKIEEFIANCGGLFGLFIGASLLSFVELIYYCSLRLMSKFHSHKID